MRAGLAALRGRAPAPQPRRALATAARRRPKKGRGALDVAISQIESMYGAGSLMRLGDGSAALAQRWTPDDVIRTGSYRLDAALGIGGLPRGRVVGTAPSPPLAPPIPPLAWLPAQAERACCGGRRDVRAGELRQDHARVARRGRGPEGRGHRHLHRRGARPRHRLRRRARRRHGRAVHRAAAVRRAGVGDHGIPTPLSPLFLGRFAPVFRRFSAVPLRCPASWRRDGENGRKMAKNGRNLGEKRARNSGG